MANAVNCGKLPEAAIEKAATMIFEVCVDSVAGVRVARSAGANRTELCANLLEGGTTPSLGLIREARRVARGGDFLFDADEFAQMKTDVETARAEGADAVVIGQLMQDGTIDKQRTQILIDLARPMQVTFHRAFDMTPDPLAALETLIELGIDRVLTSGQEATVLEGLPLISQLIRQSGSRITILPGGGITSRNVDRIISAAKPSEIHFAALELEAGGMRFRRDHVFMGGELRPPEYDRLVTSANIVRSIITSVSEIKQGIVR
jgi:copper homeostasis protein